MSVFMKPLSRIFEIYDILKSSEMKQKIYFQHIFKKYVFNLAISNQIKLNKGLLGKKWPSFDILNVKGDRIHVISCSSYITSVFPNFQELSC